MSSPPVSVVVPARNAAKSLPRALASIWAQDYPNLAEVVVAAADRESAAAAEGAVVVDNPRGSTSAGLNAALAAARGEVIVRCDAHAVLPPGYISRAVETLLRTGADNVGGMQVPVGERFWERTIAAAMSSPLGAGDARYRIGGEEGPVETAYLGVFRRSTLERLGGFDEYFLRNQDYELNQRIRESGGTVWFDPELRVEYRPRGTLGALASQYFEYGRWKRRFWRRHPGGLRWRQAVPPLVVTALAASSIAGVWWTPAWLVPTGYLALLVAASLTALPRLGPLALAMAPALIVMHLSWGVGFLRAGRAAHPVPSTSPSRR